MQFTFISKGIKYKWVVPVPVLYIHHVIRTWHAQSNSFLIHCVHDSYMGENLLLLVGSNMFWEPSFTCRDNTVIFPQKKEKQGDGPERKVTKLAIGIEGGFEPDKENIVKTETYSIFIFPDSISIPWPSDGFPKQVIQLYLYILYLFLLFNLHW